MKKSVIVGIVVVIIIAIIAVLAITGAFNGNKEETKTTTPTSDSTSASASKLEPINNAEDLSKLVDKIYENQENLLPSLQTQEIDLSDAEMVQYITGLENANDLEYVVVSEPMMSSQAYSLIIAKVKDGVNANEVAKTMHEKVDARKWICVTAEKVYATSSQDVVMLVMSSEEMAKPIYEKFKTLAGTVAQEYERAGE